MRDGDVAGGFGGGADDGFDCGRGGVVGEDCGFVFDEGQGVLGDFAGCGLGPGDKDPAVAD